MASALSPLGALVRRHDPDRFLTALFAPPGHRETLFVLYALNHELARAREAASEPTLALIRLHWWREVADGARRRHEVAGPLGEALDAGRLDASDLRGLIDAREAEADPAIPSLAAWRGYVLATAGGLAAAAGRALGADAATRARLRALGAAYGAAGILRSIAPLARQGMCRLPEDLLGAHGLTVHAVLADPAGAGLAPGGPAPCRDPCWPPAWWRRSPGATCAGPFPRRAAWATGSRCWRRRSPGGRDSGRDGEAATRTSLARFRKDARRSASSCACRSQLR